MLRLIVLRNFTSLFFRFSGTLIQFLSGIMIARFSNNEITAYYFLILSSIWISVYALSIGFPNHIFIVTSESKDNSNQLDILKKYILFYSKLIAPIISFFLISIYCLSSIFDIDAQTYFLVFLSSFLLSINRFCCEVLKGSNNETIGILCDRTIFPLLIMLNIISLYLTESFSINSINYSFIISSILSLFLSYFISFKVLNKSGPTIEKLFFDKSHVGGQYIIELGEVLINRLPIIIFNFIFSNDTDLIAGFSICYTLVSISGTINFALYPYYGRIFIRELNSKNFKQAKKKLYESQLWTGCLYTIYFLILYFFGEKILGIYNSNFVQFYSYLFLYSSLMIINQLFGVSDYLMSVIRQDKSAILFKFASLTVLLLLSYISFNQKSVEIFIFAVFSSVFIKNLLSYSYYFKYAFKN